MSHSNNLFVFSFALLDVNGQNILSSAGNHTVALVVGNEDYQQLKVSLANVTRDVNNLIKEGSITVEERKFNLEFFLGGDYKFLFNAMGMKAATSDNSCIWCKMHKNESFEMKRKLGKEWHKQPGCHSSPLFNVDIDHIVIQY
ncbi:uncharacterized protein LOC116292664 [Actinia tenebrosa]|uniref:Uncharacterized protein LOC116292664 n=1 Tax=Actinia tenebrosa TaxID=6105 RepID=A0A6P8HJ49_ACTTE|nr:uncharacterized protein LOC116292664 [Actinia tenebrosa]